MTSEEFKENINGIFIELIETKKARVIITNHSIRVLEFYSSDISDYLLTLYDYLDETGFTELEFEYWSDQSTGEYENKTHYRKLAPSQIKNLRKMRINDITLYYKDTEGIIDKGSMYSRRYRRYTESNKFENVKDVITNMNGILVDFIDLGFKYDIQPSDNEIKIKMVSLAKENIKVRIELLKNYDSQIFDIVHTLNDYMKVNNFKVLPISVEGLGKIGSKYKGFNRHNFNNLEELENSELDIVVLFLEYENMDKLISESLDNNILENLKGLIVELEDYGFEYEFNDNVLKIIKLNNDYYRSTDIKNIFNCICTICDFMQSNGYNTKIYYNNNDRVLDKSNFDVEIDGQKIAFMFFVDTLTLKFNNILNESLPRKQTVDQLKRLRKLTKGIDIGDRISDMNKQGANIDYINNPVDTGIESYEDYEEKNKDFIPSWNLKHLLDPYQHSKSKKKKKK